MNKLAQKMGTSQLAPARRAPGNPLTIAVVLGGVALIALMIVFKFVATAPSPAPTLKPDGGDDELARSVVDAGKRQALLNERSSPENSAVPRRGSRTAASIENLADASAALDTTGSAAYARQLVGQMTQLDLSKKAISKEQAAQVVENFQQLVSQGLAGLPAIREFLDKNQDLSFEGIAGANAIGHSSLRMGMIDALQQIGGPDALAIALKTLQTTGDPVEVAALARNLEQSAPGQYRQEALNAVRETLDQAAKGELGRRDVAPLFGLLQNYGDSSVIPDLEKSFPQWNYYSTMTLAGLPNGEGVPALIALAQNTSASGSGKSTFALQMLAQVAGQYPDAGAALLEQARANQIPDRTWSRIATGLAGDQYQMVGATADNSNPTVPVSGLKGYHIESGNQNFISLPVPPNLPADEIDRRLALIDQLLAANPSQTAAQALQEARQTLARRAGH